MWTVITTDLFNEWLEQQDESTQEKVLAALVVLQQQGPSLGRPLYCKQDIFIFYIQWLIFLLIGNTMKNTMLRKGLTIF